MRLRVKPRLRRLGLLGVLLVPLGCLWGWPSVGHASPGFFPRATRPLVEPAPDPELPSGPLLAVRHQRPDSEVRIAQCSSTRPVCVLGVGDVSQAEVAAALLDLENAYRDLVDVLNLPPPLLDGSDGAAASLDLFLVGGSDEPLEVRRGLVSEGGSDAFDSATAYCLAGSEAVDLRRAATLCVGEAVAWRLAPSETPFVKRAYATHLWHVVGAPGAPDFEAIDELQANPQRAVVNSELNTVAEGSSLFLDYLSYRVESSSGTRLPTAIMSLSASSTEADAWRWNNEPDIFDVVRASFQDVGMPKLLLDFAVARAFLGDRDEGTQMPPSRWTGAFGRVRFDWHLPWSSLPRHVASLRPIEPTGSTYLWLDLSDLPEADRETAGLGFRASWETPGSFAWSLVKVDANGGIMGRIDLPYLERAGEVETSLASLRGVAAIIVVGTNLGGLNAHPFDPDAAPFEPRGCTVYLAAL